MDYDKLIEQLNAWNEQHLSVVCRGKHFACDYLCENEDCIVVRAATAIETLRADLARVTAERDAAIRDIYSGNANDCDTCVHGCDYDDDCPVIIGADCEYRWHGLKWED